VIIGAHVPARGGIHNAVPAGLAVGAQAIQTHPTPAQMWRPLRLTEEVRGLYRELYAQSGLQGHHLHAVYLINLSSPKEELRQASIASLVHYLEIAAALDADSVVFHCGSHLGAGFRTMLGQIAGGIREVLALSPAHRARLLVENSAGLGGTVGRSLEELAAILEAVDDDRVGVCFDTQHAFASGYDIRTPAGVSRTLDELDRRIGFRHLHLIHANDSRSELGSNADRHANLGEGRLGLDAFRALLGDERLRRVPWILEVPGDEKHGPDRRQINLLRECAGLPPTRAEPGSAAPSAPSPARRRTPARREAARTPPTAR
jgi:deoxyribonuclease-4